MGKKKGRQQQSSNTPVIVDSSESGDAQESTNTSQAPSKPICQHVIKAVDVNNLKKNIIASDNQACARCTKLGVTPVLGDGTWFCLRCGHRSCSLKHSEEHHETPHSDSHCLAIQLPPFIVRCHSCKTELPDDFNKKLNFCITNLRQMHIKGQLDVKSGTPSAENKDKEKEVVTTTETISAALEDKKRMMIKPSTPPAVRGLSNLGNTCFFNSVLQCLTRTPNLVDVLKQMNATNQPIDITLKSGKHLVGKLDKWDPLSESLVETLESLLTTGNGVFSPYKLLNLLRKKCPQFEGYDQHDAHELLRHLLDAVRTNDLKRYRKVMLAEMGLSSKVNPQEVSEEKTKQLKQLDHEVCEAVTLVPEHVFKGLLVSTLECQECNSTSQCIESFLDLSLPVMSEKPQPPSCRRKNNSNSTVTLEEKGGSQVSKHQLKKERKMARKQKGKKHGTGSNPPLNRKDQAEPTIPENDEKGSDAEGDIEDNEEAGCCEDKRHESGYSSEKLGGSARETPSVSSASDSARASPSSITDTLDTLHIQQSSPPSGDRPPIPLPGPDRDISLSPPSRQRSPIPLPYYERPTIPSPPAQVRSPVPSEEMSPATSPTSETTSPIPLPPSEERSPASLPPLEETVLIPLSPCAVSSPPLEEDASSSGNLISFLESEKRSPAIPSEDRLLGTLPLLEERSNDSLISLEERQPMPSPEENPLALSSHIENQCPTPFLTPSEMKPHTSLPSSDERSLDSRKELVASDFSQRNDIRLDTEGLYICTGLPPIKQVPPSLQYRIRLGDKWTSEQDAAEKAKYRVETNEEFHDTKVIPKEKQFMNVEDKFHTDGSPKFSNLLLRNKKYPELKKKIRSGLVIMREDPDWKDRLDKFQCWSLETDKSNKCHSSKKTEPIFESRFDTDFRLYSIAEGVDEEARYQMEGVKGGEGGDVDVVKSQPQRPTVLQPQNISNTGKGQKNKREEPLSEDKVDNGLEHGRPEEENFVKDPITFPTPFDVSRIAEGVLAHVNAYLLKEKDTEVAQKEITVPNKEEVEEENADAPFVGPINKIDSMPDTEDDSLNINTLYDEEPKPEPSNTFINNSQDSDDMIMEPIGGYSLETQRIRTEKEGGTVGDDEGLGLNEELAVEETKSSKGESLSGATSFSSSTPGVSRYLHEEGDCSVLTCLNQFTSIELMTGNNKVGCSTCTARLHKGSKEGKTVYTMSTKQLLIKSAPPVLILHLKRFQVQMYSFRKLSKHVSFPMVLNLAPFCVDSDRNSQGDNEMGDNKEILYSLYGVVEHSGTFNGGHYVAYVKVEDSESGTRRWFCISDSHVLEVTESRVLSSQAYLLFYRRLSPPVPT